MAGWHTHRYRKNPPQRHCAECGRPMGKSWREYIVCGDCRKSQPSIPTRERELHTQQTLDRLTGTVPPVYDPARSDIPF